MTKPFGTVITLLVVALVSTLLFVAYLYSAVEDGNTLRRAAFIASPFEFVAIGSLVGAFMLAFRSNRTLIQILFGFLLSVVGAGVGFLSLAMIAGYSLRGDDPGALVVVVFVLALLCLAFGIFLLARWFAKYARLGSKEQRRRKT